MKTMTLFAATLAALAATAVSAAPPAAPAKAGQAMTRAQVQQRTAERFAKWDTNRDGRVTQAEFDAARTAQRSERRAERFAGLDTDRNGAISKAEFAAAQGGRDRDGERRGGRFAHRGGPGKGMMGGRGGLMALDADKDGAVTLAEAQARPLAMFDRADTNRDGVVTPEERRAAWATVRGPKPTA